jgi:hypothetical protein
MQGLVVFGVRDERATDGHGKEPRVAYLAEPLAVTEQVLALAGSLAPGEIFRFAAPCAGGACRHFDGSNCRLAARIVTILPPVVDGVPPCPIRPDCRWWEQEGKAACLRCPQVITERYDPPEPIREVADPASPVIRAGNMGRSGQA